MNSDRKETPHRENVLLVLRPVHAGDQSQQEVHHGAGGEVGQKQRGELWLGLNVLYDLETGVLVAVPILLRPPGDQHAEGLAEEAREERVERRTCLKKCIKFVEQ